MSKSDSRFEVVFAIGLALLGASACTQSHPCESTSDASSATLSGAAPAWFRYDGGDAVEQNTSFSFTTPASVAIEDQSTTTSPSGSCVWVTAGEVGAGSLEDVNVGIGFDCVSGPGTYQLEDIHGTACNSATAAAGGGNTCDAIAGTLTVRAFGRPCGAEGGCGRLDADLVVSSAPGSSITIDGHATLAFTETIDSCSEPLVTWPGGD